MGVARWFRCERRTRLTLPARPPSAVCRVVVRRSGLDSWTWVLACFPTGGVFTDALVTIFVCAPRPVGFCCPSPSCACFFLPPSPSHPPFVSGSCESFLSSRRLLARDDPMPVSLQADHCLSLSQVFSSPLSPSSVKVSTASRRGCFCRALAWPRRARALCWWPCEGFPRLTERCVQRQYLRGL